MSAVNEYWAFIQPLRDNPDDETARLAYTDWLDERGDPRAEYLRTERAWLALQPSDEQYRPLYRDLSRLAAILEPEWFAGVSRMAYLVRQGWQAVAHLFTPTPLPPPERAREWKETSAALRSLFVQAFGAEAVAHRFCLPPDFAAFMCAVEGFHYSHPELIEITKWHFEEYAPTQPAGDGEERTPNPEMWLQFAEACDDSWFVVCCDFSNPLFGVVADYPSGGHPWQTGTTCLGFSGRNVLQFVTEHLEAAYGREYRWPDVPFAEWATH